MIFDLFGSYDRAWQIGTLIGFAAGLLKFCRRSNLPSRITRRPRCSNDVIFCAPSGLPAPAARFFHTVRRSAAMPDRSR